MASDVRHIAVVGGGASGLAAAIAAAREGAAVTVFESQDRVGNTIRATGDGRCNVANSRTSAQDYRNGRFVQQAFRACAPAEAVGFLESLGLVLREEGEGRLYPQANKSTSVIDVLRLSAARAGVAESCGARAASLRRARGGWSIGFDGGGARAFDSVVLACGGRAPCALLPREAPVAAFQPVLGPLATETGPLRGLDKVRVKCAVSFGGHVEEGEVTFRPYGISGIAAFNMSRFVSAGDVVRLDFLPGRTQEDSQAMLCRRLAGLQPRTWLDFTCGMLLPLVARAVLRESRLDAQGVPDAAGLPAFHRALRAFPLTVRGIGDARLCQVHRGGVAVSAVDPATMQLAGFPGLHVAGELVDVDGPCGGYNLHWAWVSGILSGKAAAHD